MIGVPKKRNALIMRAEISSTLKIIRVIRDTDQMATLLKSSFKNCNSSYHKSASFFSSPPFDLQHSAAGKRLERFPFIFRSLLF